MGIELVECPSGLVVKVGGLKVRQFKRFADKRALRSGEVFEHFLDEVQAGVEEPGPYEPDAQGRLDWSKVLQGDRFAALLGVRIATHGPSFAFDVPCGRCDSDDRIAWDLDLRDLPRQPYPEDSIEAFRTGRPIVAEIGGCRVSWPLVTGAEERRIQKALDLLRKSDPRTRGRAAAAFDPLVDPIAVRISVDGVDARSLRAWIEDLDTAELGRLRDAMERASGGVETTIDVRHDLPTCSGVTKVELPFFSEEFWLPRAKA